MDIQNICFLITWWNRRLLGGLAAVEEHLLTWCQEVYHPSDNLAMLRPIKLKTVGLCPVKATQDVVTLGHWGKRGGVQQTRA